MREPQAAWQHDILMEALARLQGALELLDRASAPAHIGAHVDLAIQQLCTAVASGRPVDVLDQIDRKADPQ